MGTPEIAKAMLETLVTTNYQVVGVVTQPDKKVGRKQEIKMSEVKAYAQSKGIEVFQPIRLKEDFQTIIDWNPDLILTCAYGQFVPEEILTLPKYGCLNLHASLLPKLRGGAPIHWAVIQGEKTTGMSLMKMVNKMDAGAVMKQEEVTINEQDTMGDVYQKLMIAGSKLIDECLPLLFSNQAIFTEQDESKATFGYNIKKEEERIDFSKSIDEIYNHIRGLIPFPVGYMMVNQQKVKIHKARKHYEQHTFEIGTFVGWKYDAYAIAVKQGYILIDELQIEGKQKMDAKAFYNGKGKAWIHMKVDI